MVHSSPPPFRPHPENCAGDFYVEEGCCIFCGVPEAEAPEVFGWASGPSPSHCIVAQQPRTAASVTRTLFAMQGAEVDCIRYRGCDADISRRIVEMGQGAQCDLLPLTDAAPLTRTHVSFSAEKGAPQDAGSLARDFLSHFEQSRTGILKEHSAVKSPQTCDRRTLVEVAWWREIFHTVEFECLDAGKWLVVTTAWIPGAGIGLSLVVDRWLRARYQFRDLRWFTAKQWQAGGPFRLTVV